jgi:dihydrolipoamide dehydrogenase
MIKRSRDVAQRLSKGIEYLIKKNKIDYIPAYGKLMDNYSVETIDSEENKIQIKTENIIIATGARAKWFPGMEPDGNQIITYKEAMIPEKPFGTCSSCNDNIFCFNLDFIFF